MTKRIVATSGTQWFWRSLHERMEWVYQAACVGVDPEIFFPDHDKVAEMAAKAICLGCPVQDECRMSAPEYGIWAGETEDERRSRMRREARAARREKVQ